MISFQNQYDHGIKSLSPELRHELRKIANLKHRDPLNTTLREEYHFVLKQYKSLLTQKKNQYYHTQLTKLETAVDDPNSRNFWNCLKSMDDSVKENILPPVSEENWMSHFQTLHSNEPLNSHQEAIISELRTLENAPAQSNSLNGLITELEIYTAAKKLKNNKSPFSDKLKNEMIKSSLNQLTKRTFCFKYVFFFIKPDKSTKISLKRVRFVMINDLRYFS